MPLKEQDPQSAFPEIKMKNNSSVKVDVFKSKIKAVTNFKSFKTVTPESNILNSKSDNPHAKFNEQFSEMTRGPENSSGTDSRVAGLAINTM